MLYTVKLNNNKDFVRLYGKGYFIPSPWCTVYYRKNSLKYNRMGISTSKKIGNAVKRSRARRVIRQAYRENEFLLPKGYDIVIAARFESTVCRSGEISVFFKKRVAAVMNDPSKQKKRQKK
ncbi:MAG: ribonuclease P protein component [Oscillospiraceae bacterium]|nr:ribonuclease P protein component [Oscillospiraceae bacterium]